MKKFLIFCWKLLRNNLLLKIMAVVFAVILWSYVLADTNPPRNVNLDDIQVTYQNADALKANGLAIEGNVSNILSSVDIRVEVNQNDIKYVNYENVEAYVDLSKINSTGTQTLRISAKTSYGDVLTISPSEVTVTVDSYMTRPIPVNIVTSGSVASGYYADAPVISQSVISISGAEADIKKVTSAVCNIDLTGINESYTKSISVDLIDENGSKVDAGLFPGNYPSVIASLTVLPMKTVSVDVENSLIGRDNLAPGYEIKSIQCDPEYVQIVGEKTLLDGIEAITLVPLNIGGNNNDVVVPMEFSLPEGVRVIGDARAQVIITIREKTEEQNFDDVSMTYKNLKAGFEVVTDPASISVTVIAGVSKMAGLDLTKVVPYVDLKDITEPGTYTCEVLFELPEGFEATNFTPSTTTVTVTITSK